jgi:hypothetical protein
VLYERTLQCVSKLLDHTYLTFSLSSTMASSTTQSLIALSHSSLVIPHCTIYHFSTFKLNLTFSLSSLFSLSSPSFFFCLSLHPSQAGCDAVWNKPMPSRSEVYSEICDIRRKRELAVIPAVEMKNSYPRLFSLPPMFRGYQEALPLASVFLPENMML